MLRVETLEVTYGGVRALHGCSFTVADGECVAVLGANGAGKSSLLRAIAGVGPHRSGQIWWDGRRIDRWGADRAARHGLALVPEGRRLFPTLTVRENLLVGAVRGSSRDVQARFDRALGYFPELGHRLEVAAGRLSGGEQQMLALARALIGAPRLLMVDELSLGLAPMVSERIYDTLVGALGEGMSLVLVEQYAELAIAVAHRIIVLEKGIVTFQGEAGELRQKPELLETAYLGRDLLSSEEPTHAMAELELTRARNGGLRCAEMVLRLEPRTKRRLEGDAVLAGVSTEEWLGRLLAESIEAGAARSKGGD